MIRSMTRTLRPREALLFLCRTARYDAGKLGGEWLAKKFPKAARSRHSDWRKEFAGVNRVNGFCGSAAGHSSMYLISPQMRSVQGL